MSHIGLLYIAFSQSNKKIHKLGFSMKLKITLIVTLTFGWEAIPTANLGFSSLTATQGPAFLFQQRPRSTMDAAIH